MFIVGSGVLVSIVGEWHCVSILVMAGVSIMGQRFCVISWVSGVVCPLWVIGVCPLWVSADVSTVGQQASLLRA